MAPRTLDLLLVLAASRGRLLTKDELLRTVWGDVNVEEASLAFQISTLRKALGEYGAAWIETVPKHGYRFTAPVDGGPSPPKPARSRKAIAVIAACSAVVVIAGWSLVRRSSQPLPAPDLNIGPLTSYPGQEIQPSLSPDGSQVAYSWDGNPRKEPNIYVQLVGQGKPVPLTADPRPEFSPVWSPDGRLIAFCRAAQEGSGEIVTIPAGGGTERVIAQPSTGWVPVCSARSQSLSWFPSSDALAVVGYPPGSPARAIYAVPVTGAGARPITVPVASTWGDALPAVSPDGRYIAFTRSLNEYWVSAEVYLERLNPDKSPAGKPELLIPASIPHRESAPFQADVAGLEWLPGRDEIVYARRGLWRVSLRDRRIPVLVATPGYRPGEFSISRNGARMAFASSSWDLDIWRIPGPENAGRGGEGPAGGEALAASTALDTNPQYSADGKRIAFTSLRSGKLQIWVADADGANAVQVTQSEAWNGTPRWSPDGRYLAYDAVERGKNNDKGDIYVIPAGDGPTRCITPAASHEDVPSWSRDGRWIYYESDRTGDWQLWKTEFPSGRSVQVTTNGGVAAFESPNGRWVYYAKRGEMGLWRKPVAGGDEEQVSGDGHPYFWGLYDKGGCLLNPFSVDVTVECFGFGSPRLRLLTRFRNEGHVRPTGPSFAISPDGRWILYSRVVREQSDLMLVDNLNVLR